MKDWLPTLTGQIRHAPTLGVLLVFGLAAVVAGLLIPRATHRKKMATPTLLLAGAGLAYVAGLFLPERVELGKVVRLVSYALVLLSLSRTVFLLLVDSVIGGRLARPVPQIFRDMMQAGIVLLAVLAFLEIIDVSPGSLLTTSALLTAVIGLALQDTLGNLIAGLAIQFQGFIEVGDWIESDGQSSLAGRVTEINWRETRLVTLDQVEVIVPNSAITRNRICNFSRPNRISRRHVEVMCPYHVPTHKVHEVIQSSLRDVPGVLREPAVGIQTREFADSGITYRVYFHIDKFSLHSQIESDVRDRIWYALQRASVDIPFPIRTVYMAKAPEATTHSFREERLSSLQQVDFLRPLPITTLERLAASASRRLYAHGEVLIRQGDEGDALFILRHGEVSVLVGREGGSTAEVARLERGAFFGEMSLMTGERRSATVRATSDCEVLVVSKQDLRPILEESPALVEVIGAVLAERAERLGDNLAAREQAATRREAAGQHDALLRRIRKFFSI
ncbi:MAG: mechanosensitive ion channel family protein [Polyangiaceae bacterium]|nr:mechanosensitive ion channel family protein [Polyangiaceae bacterium]